MWESHGVAGNVRLALPATKVATMRSPPDVIFVFASENEGGTGLVARAIVTSAGAVLKKRGVARQTPRVTITAKRTALIKRRLGRSELKPFSDWNDGRPELSSTSGSIVRQRTSSLDFRREQ